MKKYTCLLLFALLLNGCDDGDLTAETFNFDEIAASSCADSEKDLLIYKLKDQESLLLQLPKDKLKNEITGTGAPQEFDIVNGGDFKLAYRTYDGTVAIANICDAIRPANPNIINEWFAIGGKIKINTTANYEIDIANNSTRISGYTHNIIIENITYSKPEIQLGPSFIFGDFQTKLKDTETLNLIFNGPAMQCPISKQVYSINGAESFTIDNLDPNLIVNTPTAPGAPRVQNITSTVNTVTFKVYSNGTVNNDYFCKNPAPTTPTVRETWVAESGTISVETSTLGENFKHIITFKNVKLVKGNISFLLGNNFKSWELITTP